MTKHSLFEVSVSVTDRHTIRNEFGWVQGFGPGDGKWHKPSTETVLVVAKREKQAREKAIEYCTSCDTKNVKVIDIKQNSNVQLVLEL